MNKFKFVQILTYCEENGKDTVVITNSDGKKIFEATLLDKE